ncbi:MAG: hypothetical protein U0228_28215 [Myxococcaceae bacterium]
MLALTTTVTPPRARLRLKTRVRASTCLRATRVGRFRSQLGKRTREISMRARRVATGSRKYLSPEPLMDTAFLVRQVLGRSAPALPFGFVGNNPVRFADPDGRRISPTVDVSYDPNGGFVLVEGREKVLRPGTQVASAYVAWQRGCGPDGRGGFKFDAEVRVNIDVRLNGDGDRPSRQDGDACTISRHEDKHVDDLVDDIFDIERAFQSEGFRTRGECDAAFERLTNASNPVPEQRGEAFRQFLRSISEATRSRRDPFEYAR